MFKYRNLRGYVIRYYNDTVIKVYVKRIHKIFFETLRTMIYIPRL